MRDLGLQIHTRYLLGAQRTRFIDRAHIADVILNEGITFQAVIYYMAVIPEGQDRLIVVFDVRPDCGRNGASAPRRPNRRWVANRERRPRPQHLRPRLDVLLHVYRGVRAVMFNEPEQPEGEASGTGTPLPNGAG